MEAFKLFDYDKQTGKLFLDPTGAQRLRALPSAPRFVSISGQSRYGKSTLGNFLLDSPGFTVSASTSGCTRGIDCRLSVDRSLAILDCEGLADVAQSGVPGLDAKLLAVALLCSDYSIFNAKKVLDESHIQEIGSMALLSSLVDPKANLAKLMFVVRDAMPAAQKLSPSQVDFHLNKILEPTAGAEDSDARSFLASAFPPGSSSRGLSFMPKPASGKEGLEALSKLIAVPKFVEGVAALKSDITKHAKTSIGDRNGTAVAAAFQHTLDGINAGAMTLPAVDYITLLRHKLAESVGRAQAEFNTALPTVRRLVKGHSRSAHLQLFVDSFSKSVTTTGSDWKTFMVQQMGTHFPFGEDTSDWIANAVGFRGRYNQLRDLVGTSKMASIRQQLQTQYQTSSATLERCISDEIKCQFRAAMTTAQVRDGLHHSQFASNGVKKVGWADVKTPNNLSRATVALEFAFDKIIKNCWICQQAEHFKHRVWDTVLTEMRSSLLEPQTRQLCTAIRQLEINLQQKQAEHKERLAAQRAAEERKRQAEQRRVREMEREEEERRQRQLQREYKREQEERERERKQQSRTVLMVDRRTGQVVAINGRPCGGGGGGGGFRGGGYNPCFGGSFGGGFGNGGFGW